MLSSEIIQPTAIGSPFAVNGNKTIPAQESSESESQTSSINDGFLPITQQPLPPDGTGIAPERTDFNGMFYLSTDQRVYLQNGGVITYDDTVATKIGGYPQGAILGYLDANGNLSYLRSTQDNNQNNFITDPSVIGSSWVYVSIKNTIEVLKLIYPVGSLYIGTTTTCPIAALFGTWELVAANKALWTGSGSNANTTIAAGLPNITGRVAKQAGDNPSTQGAFYYSGTVANNSGTPDGNKDTLLYFSASRSNSTYGKSSTVQPPAYVVNVWRRTA